MCSGETEKKVDLKSSVPDWFIYGAMVFGVLVRSVQYFYNRSFWIDESMLALNILDRSFSQLCRTLDYIQVAPIGFLFFEKAAVIIAGDSEYVFRFLPFAAGIVAIFLFYKLGRRILKQAALAIAVLLFVCSVYLIYYSSEVKPYSCDLAVALIVLVLGFKIADEGITTPGVVMLALAGIVGVWFSSSSVFTLGAVGGCLLLKYLASKDRQAVLKLSLAVVLWVVSFLVSYAILSNNENIKSQRFLDYWQDNWMPLVPHSISDIGWFKSSFEDMLVNPGGFTSSTMVAGICLVVGFVSFFKNHRLKFWMLVLPAVFAMLASGIRVFPFRGRLLLFLMPAMLLGVGEGVEGIRQKLWSCSRLAGAALVLLVVFFPALKAVNLVFNPLIKYEIKPAMKYLSENVGPDDEIYVYRKAAYMYRYYQSRFGLDESQVIKVSTGASKKNFGKGEQLAPFYEDMMKLKGRGRVWLLFENHRRQGRRVTMTGICLFFCDKHGKRISEWHGETADVYLYDFSGTNSPDESQEEALF